jgi:branched-chain amino acid transport system permease protein
MGVFGAGSALAALAGAVAGPVLVTQPTMAATIGPILFVVVVVGGLGSLTGAFLASLLIGFVQTFAVAVNVSVADLLVAVGARSRGDASGSEFLEVTVAQLAPVIPYLLLVGVLMFRPRGLMGERDT